MLKEEQRNAWRRYFEPLLPPLAPSARAGLPGERAALQATWQRVLDGLHQQGEPGWSRERGRCQYRAEGGNRCAIGQLLTPAALAAMEAGELDLESQAPYLLWLAGRLNYELPAPPEVLGRVEAPTTPTILLWKSFLDDLQRAHDYSVTSSYGLGPAPLAGQDFLEMFDLAMACVARQYGLQA